METILKLEVYDVNHPSLGGRLTLPAILTNGRDWPGHVRRVMEQETFMEVSGEAVMAILVGAGMVAIRNSQHQAQKNPNPGQGFAESRA